MANAKNILQSKTLWANVLAIGAEVALNLSGVINTGGAISIVSVLNIVLRVVTKSAVTWKLS